MYYYLKLSSLSNTTIGVAVLSGLIHGHSKQELSHTLHMSDRQIRRVFRDLEKSEVINKDMQILSDLPDNYQFPFVYIQDSLIGKIGFNKALYTSYQKSWNHGHINANKHSTRLLSLGVRTINRYRKELIDKGVVKEGKIDMQQYESVFKVKATVQQRNLEKARNKIKTALKSTDIAWIFHTLCAEHGYSKVPPPLRSDIAKALSIQKTLVKSESSVTLGDLIERLIMKWMGLWGNRPTMPSLRYLPVYYHSLFDPDDVGTTTIVEAPKQWLPSASDQEMVKTEDDYINEYNQRLAEE